MKRVKDGAPTGLSKNAKNPPGQSLSSQPPGMNHEPKAKSRTPLTPPASQTKKHAVLKSGQPHQRAFRKTAQARLCHKEEAIRFLDNC
ncbi:uncharacterized protein LOC741476 isoform X2 [Pan troglodytes]|uniref:uncharacterized protein LOC741476 isoform X2 n=1 Tax=Pan troglodytes TaxID=9598 RepID=UPI003013FB94